MPYVRQDLNIMLRGLQMDLWHSLSMRILIISSPPWDLKEKINVFNPFFCKTVLLIDNESTLPSLFPLITDKSLSDVDFLIENIKNIISKFDSNKADGGDMISIRMLELCDKFISKPPNIIFNSFLAQGMFWLQWKKADVAAIH